MQFDEIRFGLTALKHELVSKRAGEKRKIKQSAFKSFLFSICCEISIFT